MITKILEKIEKQQISISQWLLGFTGVIFIRFLLESISSPSSSGIIASDASTLVHYALFYFVAISGLMLIVYLLTKNQHTHKFVLYGLPIIWLAPLIDILMSKGSGISMTYIFNENHRILANFFTYFGSFLPSEVTIGIRLEIAIILSSIGYFVWHQTKNVKKVIASFLTSYTFLFLLIALPFIIYSITNLFSSIYNPNVSTSLFDEILNSLIPANMLHGTLIPFSTTRFLELGFNSLLSQILFVLSSITILIWFWIKNTEMFKSVIKNSRWERIGMYLSLMFLGAGYAYLDNFGKTLSKIDLIGILCLVLSWYASWMFAVHINDLADANIDKISNPSRPLVRKDITQRDMKDISYIWLVMSLVGSFIVGYYTFFMCIIFTAVYYIYSAYPLRLKVVPVLSSFLISIACLSTILAGFFFLSENKMFSIFPATTAIGIIIIFTLAVNIRDIKDIEGDRKNGINTLPVLFGNYGRQIVGVLFALSFILVPIFLSFYTLYIFAIPASIIGYRLSIRKNYKEKYIFYLYFIFVGSCIAFYLSLFWVASIMNLL